MTLLDLPNEIILHILLSLNDPDLLPAICLCHQLYDLGSVDLRVQYRLACYAAGVVDNPNCALPVYERFETLKRREQAWKTLTVRRKATARVEHLPTGIYDLTGGVYFLGEGLPLGGTGAYTRKLRWLRLPSVEDAPAEIEWNVIDIGKFISDLGLSIPENDLVAIAHLYVYRPLSHHGGAVMLTSEF